MSLDATDKAIVAALQHDGRASYAAIAEAVGLSETAVRNRVKRLTDAGVMQIVAVTDPGQLGFARQAMIGVRTTGDIEAVAAAIAALPEVEYVVITAGSYDVLAEVVCVDDAHLLELVSSRIRSIDGVRETDTLMYLKVQHETYNWGVR